MTAESESKCFDIAKAASKFSTWRKQHIGAVMVYKNKPITVGCNTNAETRLQKQYNIHRGFDPNTNKNCGHAEMIALEHLIKSKEARSIDFAKIHIFVYRQHKDGTLALAKPCAACEAALRYYGIRHIHYTGNKSYVYERYE